MSGPMLDIIDSLISIERALIREGGSTNKPPERIDKIIEMQKSYIDALRLRGYTDEDELLKSWYNVLLTPPIDGSPMQRLVTDLRKLGKR